MHLYQQILTNHRFGVVSLAAEDEVIHLTEVAEVVDASMAETLSEIDRHLHHDGEKIDHQNAAMTEDLRGATMIAG